ncbi:MAG: porin [Elusimicrobiota bacterium]
MKRLMSVLMTAAVLAGAAGYAVAAEPYKPFDRGITVSNGDKMSLDIWGRGQMMGVGQVVADPYADNFRVYEFLKQARMGFNGAYEDLFRYQVEFSYGGENQNSLQSMAGSYELMDFVADVPVKMLGENTVVKLGQFRVPYGREALGDEGFQDFSDRSIANYVTNHGRDFGLAIMGTKGNWTGTLGTFPDGGRDIAQRYLPETLGIPEIVFRAGYNDGVDYDIYHVIGTDRKLTRDTKAFYINGMFERDTRIGHSTSLLSHSVDGNLLTNAAYNPYMNRADVPNVTGITTGLCSGVSCQRGTLWNIGGDAVYRHPMGNNQAIELEGQVDWAGYQNRYGSLHMASGRVQGDYQVGSWELGVRYALLVMDSQSGFTSATNLASAHPTNVNPNGTALYQYNTGMGKPIHEIAPSITYHFRNHAMKLVADLPIYVNAPLMLDHADGAYAFGDPTGTTQTSVITTAGNSIVRRTNVSGRMLFQFQF